MKFDEMDITTLWAELAIEELVRCGVTTFVISPGSRSTPLALAVARHKRAKIVTHFDERGAGFIAVGYARGAHKPAALICTSGTAVANYLPAVVEASMDHLPLIVMSGDRPPELQDTGANQTIRQRGIFGSYVRWEQTIPCPTETIAPEFVLTTIDQAIIRSMEQNAGPVQLNFQFREPLIPERSQAVPRSYLSGVERWKTNCKAHTTYSHSATVASESEVSEIAELITHAKSGMLVVGRLKQTAKEIRGIIALAERLGWPAVTDIGSGLRLGQGVVNHLPHFDSTLLNEAATLRFDCILHLGGPLVSRRVAEFIASQKSENIVVNSHSERQESGHCGTRRVVAEIGEFAMSLSARLKSSGAAIDKAIDGRSERISDLLVREVDHGVLTELTVPRTIAREINPDHALFLASSLTVRDFDMYAPCDGPRVPIGCNRGASGIDGTVASAAGFARGLDKPTTLVIGDTALLHDLNSLALLKAADTPPITVVVVNNSGGAIFGMLQVAELGTDDAGADVFETLFLQKHPFEFKAAAEMFGLSYANPHDKAAFSRAYGDSITSGKSGVIELTFDWKESRKVRLELRNKIRSLLNQG